MFTKIIKNYFLFALLALLSNPVFSTPEQSVKEGQLSRALFTSAVHNREPIDQLNILSELISEVFFFTEFKDYQGQTLTHQWSHNNKVSHSIPFEVKGKRWRVFSSKTFVSGAKQEGTWTVKILDEAGAVISENNIDYIRPSTDAEILAGKEASEAAAAKQLDQDNEKTPESTKNNTTANPDEKNKPTTTNETNKPETSPKATDEDANPVDKTEKPEDKTEDKAPTSPQTNPQTQADEKDDAVETKSKDKSETSSEDKEADNSDPINKETTDKEATENPDSSLDKPIWDNIK